MNNTGQTGGTPDADIDAPEAWNTGTGSTDIVVGVLDTGTDLRHPELVPNAWINQQELKVSSGNYPSGLIDSNSNGRINPQEIIAFMGDYNLDGVVNLLDLLFTSGSNPFFNAVDEDGNGYVNDFFGWNFYADNNNVLDDNYHGTHVAGIIGAAGGNGEGVAGVCWQIRIISANIFPYNTFEAFISQAADAIDYTRQLGSVATNNSWTIYDTYSQALYDAISRANQAGVLFVAAAGNRYNDSDVTPHYPAAFDLPNIISVTATDHDDKFALFQDWGSNYGSMAIDLAAPGVGIRSTFPTSVTPGMSGATMALAGEGTGPTSGADALVGTFTLDLSRKGQGSVLAAIVVHDTGAASITLPAAGGTISVDVVISTAVRIWGFEGRPAVDAANVASIDAANWTERDNVMMSYGQPSAALTSYYDLTVMDWVWFATGPNGEEIMGSDIEPLLSEEPPLTSAGDVKGRPVVMTLVDDLSALDGPISTPASEPLTDPGESVQGQGFTTSAILGGATRGPTGPGQTVVATLSLTVSGTPGTYYLTLADARFVNVAYFAVPMSAVQPLEIVVAGE